MQVHWIINLVNRPIGICYYYYYGGHATTKHTLRKYGLMGAEDGEWGLFGLAKWNVWGG